MVAAHCCQFTAALIMKHFFCRFVSFALSVVQTRCLVCIVSFVCPLTVITTIYRSVSVFATHFCYPFNKNNNSESVLHRKPEEMKGGVLYAQFNVNHLRQPKHPCLLTFFTY
jgi:hypothetical protein